MNYDPFACPRCRAKLEMINGWKEYGDQLVKIQRLGCWKCGYIEGEPEDEDEEDAERF
jgi:Zn ribbon nucleic-acid-binding protein